VCVRARVCVGVPARKRLESLGEQSAWLLRTDVWGGAHVQHHPWRCDVGRVCRVANYWMTCPCPEPRALHDSGGRNSRAETECDDTLGGSMAPIQRPQAGRDRYMWTRSWCRRPDTCGGRIALSMTVQCVHPADQGRECGGLGRKPVPARACSPCVLDSSPCCCGASTSETFACKKDIII
jgi:hypothetical protein